MYLAIDAVASEFYNAEENVYHFHQSTGDKLTPSEMVGYWKEWSEKYPILSIEDVWIRRLGRLETANRYHWR